MEIYNSKTCLLWTKTADLAKDYGHEMSRNCPMVSVCTGESCIFLDPIKKLSEEDAINTEVKLTALREELKGHGEEV